MLSRVNTASTANLRVYPCYPNILAVPNIGGGLVQRTTRVISSGLGLGELLGGRN